MTALIVAPPGPLREGLRAALSVERRLETVSEADSARHTIAIQHEPALVLLSVKGPENSDLAAIQEIKARWPLVRCIVLVDTVAQQQIARAAGVEEVLVKGVPPKKLFRRIEGLLADERLTAPKGSI